jgi:hypothetical protein
MARGDDSRLYARCYCDSRKELEYGHGIVSSVRSSVCLSSLVQAFTHLVLWELFTLSCAGRFLPGVILYFSRLVMIQCYNIIECLP